jgi:hypothetical protein
MAKKDINIHILSLSDNSREFIFGDILRSKQISALIIPEYQRPFS